VSATEAIASRWRKRARRLALGPLAGAVIVATLAASAQPTSAPTPAPPNIDALPQPQSQPPIDLERIARGYLTSQPHQLEANGSQRGPGLIVFISLAMPRPTLDRLLDQAARANASVVLRGFAEGSLRHTVAQLHPLIAQRSIAVQVDPPAFDRFAVTRVPSFVLLRDGTRPQPCKVGTCVAPTDYLQVAGDVSLDYALEHMQRAAPTFQQEADHFLARLRR